MAEREEIRAAIARFLKKPIEKTTDATLLADLVQESFVLVEMVIELQESFHVRFGQAELSTVKTVGDLLDLVAGTRRVD
jgi:acyl carrier protein